MRARSTRRRVGELRPSQIMSTFGIGAIVDLPRLSVMVMGLEDWRLESAGEIPEERLLAAVRRELGDQVERLLSPPIVEGDGIATRTPLGEVAAVGVPVAPFPKWLVCPHCRLLAPVSSGLFRLRADPVRSERTEYRHWNCPAATKAARAVAARFLVACERGHMGDFPWVEWVHHGSTGCRALLRIFERGGVEEVFGVKIRCDTCEMERSMWDAFGDKADPSLAECPRGRPHLRDRDPEACDARSRTILLGASNVWFGLVLSALSIPSGDGDLTRIVEERWAELRDLQSIDELQGALRLLVRQGRMGGLAAYGTGAIWDSIERRRTGGPGAAGDQGGDLKIPEWNALTHPERHRPSAEFRLVPEATAARYSTRLPGVVLAERLREVRALIGFTRIEPPGGLGLGDARSRERRMALGRTSPRWVPACEVRGEGLFIRFSEEAVASWVDGASVDEARFFRAHVAWRRARQIQPPEEGNPGLRFVLLHSFSHALMRQLALESGYSQASIRERIYSLDPSAPDGPMAGVLLYTAAPDSEGTLGGLVSLGRQEVLERHISRALERLELCASDPLCAEHRPGEGTEALHGAACHACLFAPETSCERGNRYLDRSVLVPTMVRQDLAFFGATLEEPPDR